MDEEKSFVKYREGKEGDSHPGEGIQEGVSNRNSTQLCLLLSGVYSDPHQERFHLNTMDWITKRGERVGRVEIKQNIAI